MKVKVILRTDVAGLGEEGEVKEVAGGYARNYLLPRHMVVPATKGNMRVLEQQRAQIEQKQQQHRAEARGLADRLATLHLDFPVRVGEQGRLYGSITPADIAAQIKTISGIEIDRRSIELKEPLRALGQYDVPVRVAHAVTAHLQATLRDQTTPLMAPAASVDETPPGETGGSIDTRPEALGEDAVPIGAASIDTVVPAGETAPEPLEGESPEGMGGETGAAPA